MTVSLDSNLASPQAHVPMFSVHYFTDRGYHVGLFVCFVDFTEAFDGVNYWTLYNKLLDDNVDAKSLENFSCLVQYSNLLC